MVFLSELSYILNLFSNDFSKSFERLLSPPTKIIFFKSPLFNISSGIDKPLLKIIGAESFLAREEDDKASANTFPDVKTTLL